MKTWLEIKNAKNAESPYHTIKNYRNQYENIVQENELNARFEENAQRVRG